MSESDLHHGLVVTELVLAALAFIVLFFVSAPYGRHRRSGWGPEVPSRLGWLVMESVAALGFLGVFLAGDARSHTVPRLLAALWLFHYGYRAFVHPLRMRASGKRMPLVVMLLAMVFNTLNAWVNARWVSHLGDYPDAWLGDPRLLAGALLFVAGFVIHVRADSVLFRLRAPGETGYRIPHGALHDRVASPNYFGEILQWTGWALATWSGAGAAFAVFTVANLLPRALSHRRWYAETFPDYPSDRRALIPWVL